MFYISKDYGDGIYGVTDTGDNIEEKYSLNEIREFQKQGVKIKGVGLKTDKVYVYPTFDDYCKTEISKLRLLGGLNGLQLSSDYHTLEYCDKGLSVVKIPSTVTKIKRHAFFRTNFETIEIPDSVSIIDKEAFTNCYEIKRLEIPNSVIEIGEGAFMHCVDLELIKLPNSIKTLSESLFAFTALRSMDIPNSVTRISESVFFGCKNLNSVNIPYSVVEIGALAFGKCENLKDIFIPPSVTKIGADIFTKIPKIVVGVKSGSYAEEYCKDNKIHYKVC